MMSYWQSQYEAGEFENAASVYASDAMITVAGTEYRSRTEIITWFTYMYSISQTVRYTISTLNAPDENNQVRNLLHYNKLPDGHVFFRSLQNPGIFLN